MYKFEAKIQQLDFFFLNSFVSPLLSYSLVIDVLREVMELPSQEVFKIHVGVAFRNVI